MWPAWGSTLPATGGVAPSTQAPLGCLLVPAPPSVYLVSPQLSCSSLLPCVTLSWSCLRLGQLLLWSPPPAPVCGAQGPAVFTSGLYCLRRALLAAQAACTAACLALRVMAAQHLLYCACVFVAARITAGQKRGFHQQQQARLGVQDVPHSRLHLSSQSIGHALNLSGGQGFGAVGWCF
jgi:hypothetical protein